MQNSVKRPTRQKHSTKKIDKMFDDIKKEIGGEFPRPTKGASGATVIDASSYLNYDDERAETREQFFKALSFTKSLFSKLRGTPYYSTKKKGS